MIDFDDRLTAVRDAVSAMDPHADLWARAVDSAKDPAASVRVQSVEPASRRPSLWLAAAAVAAVTALGVALLQPADDEQPVATAPETSIGRPVWSGPVREPSDVVQMMAVDEQFGWWDSSGENIFGRKWDDQLDASEDWVDITRVSDHSTTHPKWGIALAAAPPRPADLEPGVVIAYGLVFDTTGDGVADYVVGIDNDTPVQGDFHVWVTNLATGETQEQNGPPYGFPVDFVHPSERGQDQAGPATMTFFFLPGGVPAGLQVETARFYAWTSATRKGVVFAHDYAPDAGWITRGAP